MLSRQPTGGQCPRRVPSRSSRLTKAAKTFRLPRPIFDRSIEEYFIALDTPVSLSCLMLYRAGEFHQLVHKEIDALDYICASRFRDDFAAISYLRKADFLQTGIDKRSKALQGFILAEQKCESVNSRFRNLLLDPSFQGSNVWLLHSLTRKIGRVLHRFDVDEFFDSGKWGPGVTTLVKGQDVSASRKFRDERGITQQLYPLVSPYLTTAYPHWFPEGRSGELEICKGNSVITVPKNAKTDRTIGIEPGINSWFQLSLGSMIRRRLKGAGYDLNSDINNQSGALKGSKTGRLATVDFSAASDTIAIGLVREILPPRWFTVLDCCRSHCYTLDGTTTPYRKFSAMGCGFTFELESLIFLSAALACCEYLGLDDSDVSVFGDDIIIPVEAYSTYHSFCEFLGFTVNQEKSFSSGLFRESCGSYFFDGKDVKPAYLKQVSSTLSSVFRQLNQIRLASHDCITTTCDRRFIPVWRYLVRAIPADLRLFGPPCSGDACIHENMDVSRWKRPSHWLEGFVYSGFVTQSIAIEKDDHGLHIANLWRSSQGTGNLVPLRGVTKQRIKTSLFAHRWYNFGPWD